MCVRSKISYGCGCVHKTTRQCHSSTCSGVDRYRYIEDQICSDCKTEGTVMLRNDVSRGRAGNGGHVQTKSRSRIKDMVDPSGQDTQSIIYNVRGEASPWAPQTKSEKTWESPHRMKADEAWVSEHEDRMMDLQDRLTSTKISDKHSRSDSTKDGVLLMENLGCDEYDKDNYAIVRNTPSKKIGRISAKRISDYRIERTNSHQHEARQNSHDSLPDTMPSYRSSPRLRHASTSNIINSYPEVFHDHDKVNEPLRYPSKHLHRRHRHTHSRSMTEPFISAPSYGYDSDYDLAAVPPPIQIPPPATPIHDTYDFYTPGMTSSAPYTYTDYPYDIGHAASLQPQHYVGYQRY